MMKLTLLTTILLINLSFIFAQENKEITLLESRSKTQLYYVELNAAGGRYLKWGVTWIGQAQGIRQKH
jgi:hypothetical protein